LILPAAREETIRRSVTGDGRELINGNVRLLNGTGTTGINTPERVKISPQELVFLGARLPRHIPASLPPLDDRTRPGEIRAHAEAGGAGNIVEDGPERGMLRFDKVTERKRIVGRGLKGSSWSLIAEGGAVLDTPPESEESAGERIEGEGGRRKRREGAGGIHVGMDKDAIAGSEVLALWSLEGSDVLLLPGPLDLVRGNLARRNSDGLRLAETII
jgi:hypothetical protein